MCIRDSTVGFIRNLPPVLVTAFRATLEEITAADLIVLLADATSGRFEEDLAVVEETLASIGAGTIPRIIAINKADRVDTDTMINLRTLAGRSGVNPCLLYTSHSAINHAIGSNVLKSMLETKLAFGFSVEG